MSFQPQPILVTGDVGPDFDIYLHFDGPNPPLDCAPTRIRCSAGGAGLAHRILAAWAGDKTGATVGFAPSPFEAAPTLAVWNPQPLGKAFKPKGDKEKVWRVTRSTSPGEVIKEFPLPTPTLPPLSPPAFAPGVVLLVDNAAGFRHPRGTALPHEAAWTQPSTFVIWKMAPPFCRGELWWRALTAEVLGRTAIVLSLEHLRMEPVRISRRISWERTALEISRELESNPALAGLRAAAHVIVTIHGDGALWRRRTDAGADFTLFFDPGHMESEWGTRTELKGGAYGYGTAFAAALVAGCAERAGDAGNAIGASIPKGLLAMRALRALGHGPVASEVVPDFPLERLAEVIRNGIAALSTFERGVFGEFSSAPVPWKQSGATNSAWRIASSGSSAPAGEPLYGLARRVAVYGHRELRGVPHARFGKLLTVDRDEIEALRNLQTLIEDYKNGKENKPLSLAVFGPPGAGKSFGVKQIAEEVLRGDGWVLEFNLSQFNEEDLVGAFHQVRDKVLEGKMPVVFWDEFDCSRYTWLKRLLAPMNDGKFQEGPITHPLGRCIFVFAGGTSYTMENFGPREVKPGDKSDPDAVKAWEQFKLDKGPDFKSRVHGSLNVIGPNRRMVFEKNPGGAWEWIEDPTDVCFPLRRAVLLRALLGLKPDQRLDIDSGLLSALLEVRAFTNGSRSFEKICTVLRDAGKTRQCYRPSDLPADPVLAMNVADLPEFKALLVREEEFKEKAGLLAKAFHDVWRKGKRKQKGTEPFNYDCEFDQLPPNKKSDNLNAAMRMPRNLLLGGYCLVPIGGNTADRIAGIPDELVDIMAEEEHCQWVADAIADGFRQMRKGEKRDDKQLIHDCILPWAKLPSAQQDYDRWFVRQYPEFAESAGFQIVPIGRAKR